MQNFNNYNAYGGRINPMGYPYGGSVYQPQQFQQYQPQQQYAQYQQQPMAQPDDRVFVSGRAGAEAYQLPTGVAQQILWDSDKPRFYVKGYDSNGRPRVLEDNDYAPHTEEEQRQNDVDLSSYATKDDINAMINEALKKHKGASLAGYVTKNDLKRELSKLCVGSGGRVVMDDESDV